MVFLTPRRLRKRRETGSPAVIRPSLRPLSPRQAPSELCPHRREDQSRSSSRLSVGVPSSSPRSRKRAYAASPSSAFIPKPPNKQAASSSASVCPSRRCRYVPSRSCCQACPRQYAGVKGSSNAPHRMPGRTCSSGLGSSRRSVVPAIKAYITCIVAPAPHCARPLRSLATQVRGSESQLSPQGNP